MGTSKDEGVHNYAVYGYYENFIISVKRVFLMVFMIMRCMAFIRSLS